MRVPRLLTALLAAVLGASAIAANSTDRGQPPTDYVALADAGILSTPDFPDTVRDTIELASWDGTGIHLEITRPNPETYPDLGPIPIVLESSPYHGTIADREGTRIFPDPVDAEGNKIGLTGFFAPRGYAVAMMDLRGTGQSGGCLDHLGPNDARDLEFVIEWLAAQEWSNGRVGMTGHSYVGSTPSVAAAMRPDGLATIVPSAGLASMYDHQFQSGVPYLLQYVGPQAAYVLLALAADMPPGTSIPLFGYPGGDDFGNHPTDTGCALLSSAALAGSGQFTGQYELWHGMRDWREGASAADIPVFLIHGVNDNAARIPAAEWFFGDRFDRGHDKVWIGQWDHGSTNGRCGDESNGRVLHPTCRFDQFQEALHAWFDKHLKGMDVDTGPAVEAFLNSASTLAIDRPVDPMNEQWGRTVVTDDAWERPTTYLELWPDARDGSLAFGEPDGAATAELRVGANALLLGVGSSTIEFASEPFATDTVFLGLPDVQLEVSMTTGQRADLIATLFRVDATGGRQPMTTCAIVPLLRHGVEQVAPVVPGQIMTLDPTCFTMAHHVPAGQSIVLEVGSNSPHHAPLGGGDARVSLHTGPGGTEFRLPVVADAVLHRDVALRR